MEYTIYINNSIKYKDESQQWKTPPWHLTSSLFQVGGTPGGTCGGTSWFTSSSSSYSSSGWSGQFTLKYFLWRWDLTLEMMELQPCCSQDRTRKSQQQQQQQQIFPQVRGRCGPRFTFPSGAPTRCEAGWVTSRHDDDLWPLTQLILALYDQWCLSRVATCCSARGWCTNAPDDCLCDDCIYYEWEEGWAASASRQLLTTLTPKYFSSETASTRSSFGRW